MAGGKSLSQKFCNVQFLTFKGTLDSYLSNENRSTSFLTRENAERITFYEKFVLFNEMKCETTLPTMFSNCSINFFRVNFLELDQSSLRYEPSNLGHSSYSSKICLRSSS